MDYSIILYSLLGMKHDQNALYNIEIFTHNEKMQVKFPVNPQRPSHYPTFLKNQAQYNDKLSFLYEIGL